MKIKLTVFIVLVIVAVTSFSIPALCEDIISIMFNGEKINADVSPIIVDGRALVPMRAIFEKFGAVVNYDPKTKMITATRTTQDEGTRRIVLIVGDVNATVDVNGVTKEYVLDVGSVVIEGRVLVPLRFIGEAFGAAVKWDGLFRQVLIDTADNIWDDPFDPWHDLNAYQAVYVVNEYLALLQGAVWGGALYDYYPILFSKRVREAPEPWAIIWQPSMPGMVGTSVCRLNFRVLDGHIAGKDESGNNVYEIAARVQSYDPRAGEPAFTDWIKAYRVIVEEYTAANGGRAAHWVIDGERTIKEVKLQSKDMPDFWHSFN